MIWLSWVTLVLVCSPRLETNTFLTVWKLVKIFNEAN